jgi:hypothetical protein
MSYAGPRTSCTWWLLLVSSMTLPAAARAEAPAPTRLDDAGVRAASALLAPVELRADLSRLPDTERRALVPLVHAAQVLEALAIRQSWGGNGEVLVRLLRDVSPSAPLRRAAFVASRAAWWDAAGNVPLADGIPPQPPDAGTFYPPDATKAEIESWLAGLDPAERKRASGFYTVVRRTPDGHLAAVPYSVEYQPELARAAALLREAAGHTSSPSLRALLEAQAAAFTTNDYRAAEAAQVALDGPVYAALAPYDTDADGWFGAKAGFISTVGVTDEAATRRLAAVAHELPALQARLPAAETVRARATAPPSPLQVVDVVYASPVFAGLSLPQDPAVIAEKGMRTAVFANTIRARYQATFAPLQRRLFAPGQARFTADDAVLEVGLVRLMDVLGPGPLSSGTTVAAALGPYGGPMLQVQSMLLSLWAHEDLIARGVLPAAGRRAIYPAFVTTALRFMLAGPKSAPGRAYAWILGGLLDAGAVRNTPAGLVVDEPKARAFAEARLREVLARDAAGDAEWAKAQIAAVDSPRPEVEALLTKAAGIPLAVRYTFSAARDIAGP